MAEAHVHLGKTYLHGDGLDKDVEKAGRYLYGDISIWTGIRASTRPRVCLMKFPDTADN